MSAHDASRERFLELASEHATVGLDEPAAAELDQLVRAGGPEARELLEDLELAAAEVHLGFLLPESPPAGLEERLRVRAQTTLGPAVSSARPTRAWYAGPALPWLAAAAVLLVILSLRGSWEAPAPDPVGRMQALLSSDVELLRADWSPGPDPLGEAVEGTLVWSPARQEGYMRFARLPRNDARELQYQLWIFDRTRADPPVDGGVFDVGPEGEVVIPIDAKLEVFDPHLFAVTAEPPGGVVVSSRERIVALASID